MSKIPSFGPKCPNHAVTLVDLPFPLKPKMIGICPISGASFEVEVEIDENEMVQDKNGNISKKVGWKLIGNDQ